MELVELPRPCTRVSAQPGLKIPPSSTFISLACFHCTCERSYSVGRLPSSSPWLEPPTQTATSIQPAFPVPPVSHPIQLVALLTGSRIAFFLFNPPRIYQTHRQAPNWLARSKPQRCDRRAINFRRSANRRLPASRTRIRISRHHSRQDGDRACGNGTFSKSQQIACGVWRSVARRWAKLSNTNASD